MPELQIDFEEGFDGDTVVVSAGGRQLWRAEGVTTNLSANVAAVARVDVRGGAELEVEVPTRRLRATHRVETPFLEVDVTGGRLVLRPSAELPRHL